MNEGISIGMRKVLRLLRVDPSRWRDKRLLAPLQSSSFTFEDNKLLSLGDAQIAERLSSHLFDYCMRRELVVTAAGMREVLGCLHNHYALRALSERLCLSRVRWGAPEPVEALQPATVLAELEPPPPVLSRWDLQGTSFDFMPHAFAQSREPSMLSNLIGAICVDQGVEAARSAIDALYGENCCPESIPKAAAELLQAQLRAFSPLPVALSILASQGVSVTFKAKAVMIPPSSSSAEPTGAQPNPKPAEQLQETSIAPTTNATPASLKDQLEMAKSWQEKTGSSIVEGGWLPPKEAQPRAFAATLNMGICPLHADRFGVPQPKQGKYVARAKLPKGDLRDPVATSEILKDKDGIDVDTQGMTLPQYLKALSMPHRRCCEVVMVSKPYGAVVGTGVAGFYVVARVKAAESYLQCVMEDVAKFPTLVEPRDK